MELRKESEIRFDSIKDEAPLARLERAAHGLGIRFDDFPINSQCFLLIHNFP